MKNLNYVKGEIIFNEGDASDQIYKIIKGSVQLVSNYGKETEVVIIEKEDGAYFGEIASTLGKPRSATAIATSDCTILVYETEELMTKGAVDLQFIADIQVMLIHDFEKLVTAYLKADIAHAGWNDEKAIKDRKADFDQNPEQYIASIKEQLPLYKNFYYQLRAATKQPEGGHFPLLNVFRTVV